jgi:hypothetical protein
MLGDPKIPEVDHRTMKLLIGWLAIADVFVPAYFARPIVLDSISQAYWAGLWPNAFFVGFQFAIGALMLTYNGFSRGEMIASKLAAAAAFGEAIFPCQCNQPDEVLPGAHATSATVMFLLLVYFCWKFRQRALEKHWREARRRARIYLVSAGVILLAMLAIAIDNGFKAQGATVGFFGCERFTFYGEATGLFAFAVSWLLASQSIPIRYVTHPKEQFSPLDDKPPPDHPDIHDPDFA